MDVRHFITAALLAIASVEQLQAASEVIRNERIEKLLEQMTFEEKTGQLTQLVLYNHAKPIMSDKGQNRFFPLETGSVIGFHGAEATRQLQRNVIEGSRLRIPLLFSYDVVHGFRTVFPVPIAEAASWDPDLAQRTARAAAVEATASGLHWTFAPMVDIARDPRWGRVVEGAGEDPFLSSAFTVARVRGYRGTDVRGSYEMLATAKHFVAYGAAEGGRDYNTADISERTLHEVYLPPFRAAVEAGVDGIMPGLNEIAGIPMHANRALLNDLLRQRWAFDGLLISDYKGVEELIKHGAADSPTSAVHLALEATVDIDMASGLYAKELSVLIKSGELSQHSLDNAVRRVLHAKQKLGLFDDPYRYSDPTREQALTLTPQTRALAREAAQKSIVLLKNDGGLLPLSKDLRRLVVVGELAADSKSTLGPFAAVGRPDESITVLEGIKRAISPATHLVYVPGASPASDERSGIDEAERAVMDADAVIAVLGESSDMSGEARSRAFLGFSAAQEALLVRLVATRKPLVVILMNGRPLAVPMVAEQAPAIIESWFLGSEMGNGLADVLFGDVSPSGKLPITVPRSVGQVPIYYEHKSTGRKPDAAITDTSKYIDQLWTPLYPFGYGLSYTTFTYSTPVISQKQLTYREVLSVQVTVQNTGQREGEEVVQLYLRDDVASITRSVRSLRGFTRVKLAPGEARTINFVLDQDDFALLDKDFLRVVEPGTFTVFVGGNSTTDNQASFEVTTGDHLTGLGSAIPRMLREPSVLNEKLVSDED